MTYFVVKNNQTILVTNDQNRAYDTMLREQAIIVREPTMSSLKNGTVEEKNYYKRMVG